jgi:transposase InsO family protein
MGVTIQFESHRVELAAVYDYEHAADVLEYYDQPPSMKLSYTSSSGRGLGLLHTPDFFVIRRSTAGWEEWKTEEDLQKLYEHNPHRYRPDPEGHWCCPPGESRAKELGLYYCVRSSREINWVFQRNIQFLDDYFRRDSSLVSDGARERVLALVTAAPGLSLESLFKATQDTVTRDEIYALMAEDKVYVDLQATPLAEPSKVAVFASQGSPQEFVQRLSPFSLSLGAAPCPLSVGCVLMWDSAAWKVINIGQTTISLLRDAQTLTEVPVAVLEALAKEGRVSWSATTGVDNGDRATLEILSRASDNALRVANQRLAMLTAGETPPLQTPVSSRTLRRWKARFRQAQESYRNGFAGLLPHTERRGNATAKLPQATTVLMQRFITEDYETAKQKSKFASWISLRLACEREGLAPPSYQTFRLAIPHRSAHERALRRQGRRAAYAHEAFHWYLEQTTPRHGDRPFEIAHIDHTQLDVELVCSDTGHNLGRPWTTLCTDAFSRRILAVYVTFDAPSYRSCMMVMRECVHRHGRLPQIVVVDGGKEFESLYFETLLARHECIKKTRPPAAPRFGSVCERIFGMANTRFVHNLRGNTQIMRCVRQVTVAVNPKNLAVWTLPHLYTHLCEFAYEVYDTTQHPSLGKSPREAFEKGLTATGHRLQRMVPYNREFAVLTLPAPRRGTVRVQAGRGVKVNYLYYWSEAFRNPEVEGQRVAVRYEPFDAGTAYAFVCGQWVECHSELYTTFRGRSEKEIMLASRELVKRHQNHAQQFNISGRRLAEFLQSVEAEEALLTQRLRDRDSQEVRSSGSSAMARSDAQGDESDAGGATLGSGPEAESPGNHEIYGEF